MTVEQIACIRRRCQWLAAPLEVDGEIIHVCRAYPAGIPADVQTGADLHNEVRGDEIEAGVVYKPPPIRKG